MLTPEQRHQILSNTLMQVVAQGGRVEYADQFSATVVYGHRVNHLLHFLITILLLGIWLIVWIILAITGREKRQIITVDEWGRVSYRNV